MSRKEKSAEEKAKLEFYRSEGVEDLIRRYPVSEEERKILLRARRAAMKDRVTGWESIEKADRLVQEIYKERKPRVNLALEILKSDRRTSRSKLAQHLSSKPFAIPLWMVYLFVFLMAGGPQIYTYLKINRWVETQNTEMKLQDCYAEWDARGDQALGEECRELLRKKGVLRSY